MPEFSDVPIFVRYLIQVESFFHFLNQKFIADYKVALIYRRHHRLQDQSRAAHIFSSATEPFHSIAPWWNHSAVQMFRVSRELLITGSKY